MDKPDIIPTDKNVLAIPNQILPVLINLGAVISILIAVGLRWPKNNPYRWPFTGCLILMASKEMIIFFSYRRWFNDDRWKNGPTEHCSFKHDKVYIWLTPLDLFITVTLVFFVFLLTNNYHTNLMTKMPKKEKIVISIGFLFYTAMLAFCISIPSEIWAKTYGQSLHYTDGDSTRYFFALTQSLNTSFISGCSYPAPLEYSIPIAIFLLYYTACIVRWILMIKKRLISKKIIRLTDGIIPKIKHNFFDYIAPLRVMLIFKCLICWEYWFSLIRILYY